MSALFNKVGRYRTLCVSILQGLVFAWKRLEFELFLKLCRVQERISLTCISFVFKWNLEWKKKEDQGSVAVVLRLRCMDWS